MSDLGYSYEVTRYVRAYQCPICGKEFPTRRIAERHLKACQQTEADAAERAQSPEDTFAALVRASRERAADGGQRAQGGTAT